MTRRTQFRYAAASFRSTVLAALGLTAIVTFLVWLFARLFGLPNATSVATVTALIFFAFCSAAMIWRYTTGAAILAARPDGLLDRRFRASPVPWDDVKELRLQRRENEFAVAIYLWPPAPPPGPAFVSDLAPLDADVATIVDALQHYHPVVADNAL